MSSPSGTRSPTGNATVRFPDPATTSGRAALKAQHPDLGASGQAPDLGGDRREDLGLGRFTGDQLRDAPEGGLLLREHRDRLASLRVRNRGRDELCEIREPSLGSG